MRIIPAIDIIDGKCVRLTQGDYDQKRIYNDDPVSVAASFENAGIRYLHLVDLDGAKSGKVINWEVVKAITSSTKLVVDFGGGVKTPDELKKLFDLGVAQVNLGSIAVKNPELVKQWITEFGEERIILSADVRDERIAINGWSEAASMTIDELLSDYVSAGLMYVVCTDISTDGMLSGPNIKLYERLVAKYPTVRLVASGGVSEIGDVSALQSVGVDGVIIGKAIYEGRIQLTELT